MIQANHNNRHVMFKLQKIESKPKLLKEVRRKTHPSLQRNKYDNDSQCLLRNLARKRIE
jgi:hypothetical protein